MDEFGIREGLTIDLKKVIPVAAGMAGEFDAAAAMMGVNKIFGLGLSRRDLMQRATAIGGGCALLYIEGNGACGGSGKG